MSAHTPGPWSYREDDDFYSMGWAIDSADNLGIVAQAEDEDDARLIAAAPDLLAALEWQRDFLDQVIKGEVDGRSATAGLLIAYERCFDALHRARAKGES